MTPPGQREGPAMAGSREAAEPGDVTDGSGDADGRRELIIAHLSWLRQVITEPQLTDEPGAQRNC